MLKVVHLFDWMPQEPSIAQIPAMLIFVFARLNVQFLHVPRQVNAMVFPKPRAGGPIMVRDARTRAQRHRMAVGERHIRRHTRSQEGFEGFLSQVNPVFFRGRDNRLPLRGPERRRSRKSDAKNARSNP